MAIKKSVKKQLKKNSNLDALNAELEALGMDSIEDVDKTPERNAYFSHLEEADYSDKEWLKIAKQLRIQHKLAFHKYVAVAYPYLKYEIGEDKIYWNYNEQTGVYDEVNFTTVRGYIIKLLIEDGMEDVATEATAKTILSKFRAMFTTRGVAYDAFDSELDWFHVQNGWINVHTLAFEDHTPDRISRRVSAVTYDAKATCPTYDKFLDEQMQLKPDQVRVIDQFSGLLLTPDISKQKMLVLIGKPGSGKSTLLDIWSDVLGDCATQKGLTEISSESFRFGGSSLIGKRLCWFDEVEVTRANMGNALINLITGQHIHVERKGINGILDADNHLKCVLTANTLPRSAEMGIYRRMILIYLEYSFYDSMTANHDIRNVLKKEASGVLNRMLRGLADLQKNKGFTQIQGHEDLIEEYKSSSNTIAEFLDEYFEFDYEAKPISTKIILEAYKTFSNDRYAESLTPQRFGMMMKHHGLTRFDKIFVKKDRTGSKEWCGLKLRDCYEFNSAGYIREKAESNF
ncbi:viral dsdna helicase [Caudoviricetes sp.]|nr:viral dsdna helicase [Caudoviricetes sp.]